MFPSVEVERERREFSVVLTNETYFVYVAQ